MNYVQNKEVKKLISLEEKRQIYITYSALEQKGPFFCDTVYLVNTFEG